MADRERFVPGRQKTESHFWLISIILHVGIAIVILLSPVGQSLFTKERKVKPEIVRKNEELAEVVEDIRDLAVDRLKNQVALLEAGQDRMANNFDTMNKHHAAFAEQQLETARIRFDQEAVKTMERLRTVFALTEQAHADRDQHLSAVIPALDENEARILSGMEEVRRGLRLLLPDNESVLNQQKEVEEAQLKAMQFLRWATGTHSGIVRNRARLEKLETEVPAAKERLEQATQALAAAELALKQAKEAEVQGRNNVSQAKKNQQQAQRAEANAKKRFDAAKQKKDEALIATATEDYKKEQQAHVAAKTARGEAEKAYKAAQEAKRQAEQQRRDASNQHRNESRVFPRLEAEQKKLTESLPNAIESRDNNTRIGLSILRGVVDKQQLVIERASAIMDGKPDPAPEEAAPEPEASTEAKEP